MPDLESSAPYNSVVQNIKIEEEEEKGDDLVESIDIFSHADTLKNI